MVRAGFTSPLFFIRDCKNPVSIFIMRAKYDILPLAQTTEIKVSALDIVACLL